MCDDRELVELSLAGKWMQLAKLWLSKRGSCTPDQFLAGVRRYMPLHIVRSGCKASQKRLAREAMSRIAIVDDAGMLQPRKPHRRGKGYTAQIMKLAKEQERVYLADCDGMKKNTFRRLALVKVKTGNLIANTDGSFSLAKEVCEESAPEQTSCQSL